MRKRILNSKADKKNFNKIVAERFKLSSNIKNIILENDQNLTKKKILRNNSETIKRQITIKTYMICKQPLIHCCNKYMVDASRLTSKIKASLNKEIFSKTVKSNFNQENFVNNLINFENISPNCYYSYSPLKLVDRTYRYKRNFFKFSLTNKYQNSFRIFEAFKGILYAKPEEIKTETPIINQQTKLKLEKEYTVTIPINRISDVVVDEADKFLKKNERISQDILQSTSNINKTRGNKFEILLEEQENLLEKTNINYQPLIISPTICLPDSYKLGSFWGEEPISLKTLEKLSALIIREKSINRIDTSTSRSFYENSSHIGIFKSSERKKGRKNRHSTIKMSKKTTFYERVNFEQSEMENLEDESKGFQLAINYTEVLIENGNRILEKSYSGNKRYHQRLQNSKVISYYGNFGYLDGIELLKPRQKGKTSLNTNPEILFSRESFKALSHMYNLRMLVAKSSMMDRDDEQTLTLESILKNNFLNIENFSSQSSSTVSSDYSLGPVDNDLVEAFTKKLSSVSSEDKE